ncbi:MAG: CDP-diacylglycerol--glycerol-3-phosphate 3-phosphatidyltransferase [Ignavibacteriae bacterium HGW-Ignavibacteriae-1]|jgi:CDP-diacylglycerol--glycerol-3-phosphate 3-phosphatidyltransferase|nr:MAG: CDP-diacylglycerol--glycerol-3-phosphate 3-phosphatidyltransferase [Ignavibacteriae bacterium HGW-Ignavibacteriae-1]
MNHLPNILSIFRLILAPFFYVCIISDNSQTVVLGVILFIVGALTDYLDGLLARKYQAISSVGKFLDPLADKVLTGFALVAFSSMKIIPLWMVLIVLFRDLLTTMIRTIDTSGRLNFKTSEIARIKTFIQMAFIAAILFIVFLYHTGMLEITQADYDSFLKSDWIDYTMLFIVLLTLYTFVDYILKIFVSFKKKK